MAPDRPAPSTPPTATPWLALAECERPAAIFELVLERLAASPGCLRCGVLWLGDEGDAAEVLTGSGPADAMPWLQAAASRGEPARSGDGCQHALPLAESGEWLWCEAENAHALDQLLAAHGLLLQVAGRQLARARANEALQARLLRLQHSERLQVALLKLAQLASESIGEGEFYRRVHQVVGALIPATNFLIALLSEDRLYLEFPYFADAADSEPPSARPLRRGVSEYVIRSGEALLAQDSDLRALADSGEVELPPQSVLPQYWLGAPLIVGDQVIGLVVVQSHSEDTSYGPADRQLLAFVATQIATSLDRRRSAELLLQANFELEQRVEERTRELRDEIAARERIQEQLKHQVMHDPLTGLPNRSYLRDRLERVLARARREPQRRYALLYLDIDRFKLINDSLGHLAGDEVLKAVARRLLTCVREQDVASRLSGDEFAILLEDVDKPTAIRVAERVILSLGEPLEVVGKLLEPSASVGIALSHDAYQIADEVLRDADTALYRAKESGRKRYALFAGAPQQRSIDVLAMEGELRTALAQDQFQPYFQPIVRLDTHEVAGYEALLRWNHPTRGVLGPGDFLQVAEDSGNVEAIDWRMFELSCSQAKALCHDGCYLSINVSPLHLRRPEFYARLIETLQGSGLAMPHLLIEVTEGSLLDSSEQVRSTLERMRADGIRAALDDFGTGYSALSYLHNFPLRLLKIDRSFVAELGSDSNDKSATVVLAVIELAKALGMEVVAEGIETEAQRDALRRMGCRLGQGFLLGRPAPLERWL